MAGILVLSVCYILSHFYRSFLAVLFPAISAELGMSPSDLSTALGAWFVAFALSQFPVGVLLDRFGPKLTTVAMFAIAGGGGGLLFSLAQSGTMILVAMVLLGIGCAPVLMASVYIFKLSYPPKRFATLMSWFIAIGLLGNILGSSPLAWAVEAFGWRGTTGGLVALTLILSALVYVLVDDPRREDTGPSGGSYLSILKMRELWWILPLIAINYAVSGGLRGIWAGPFLDQVHGLSASGIGQVTFWMALALTAGAIAYGPADNFFNTRKWVVLPGAVIGLVALVFWTLNPQTAVFNVSLVLIVIGFTSMSYGVLMAHATANIPQHLAGRGVTLVNFFNMGGVGFMQWITSGVFEASDKTAAIDGYQNVLWVYVILLGAAIAIYAFARDVKPRPDGADL